MLQQDEPDDYVLATGVPCSVQKFAEMAFQAVGLNWQDFVVHDSRYDRPTEVEHLLGDPSKATSVLGWSPATTAPELARIMVESDVKYVRSRL